MSTGRPPFVSNDEGSRWTRQIEDKKFIKAMTEAVRKGKENPPLIGIDQRPSTIKPKFWPARAALPLRGSISSDVSDVGGEAR